MNVSINEKTAKALYDPGANISITTKKFIDKIGVKISDNSAIDTFRTISGIGKLKGIIETKLKIIKIEDTARLFVIDQDLKNYDIILGLDIIKQFRLRQNENLKISQAEEKHKNNIISTQNESQINSYEVINTESIENKIAHLDSYKKTKTRNLIKKFTNVFATNKFDVGTVKDHIAHIKLSENKYVFRKPYRCSIEDNKIIEQEINDLLKNDLIEPTSSPFASPVTLAYKKDENSKNRLCVDFKELNKIVIPQGQPFPLIEDILTKTRNCNWFTSLDINRAFWSIPIRSKDRYKTAFVTQQGHWQWKNMPFGLKTASAIFQRAIMSVIRKYNLSDFCVAYIDDILVFSKDYETHLKHVEQVMEVIKKEGWKLKLAKCNFAANETQYLGFKIKKNEVKPINDNLVSINKFPIPQSKKNVRQFLGKINYYHKYIPEASKLLEPLHNLLRKNIDFIWAKECQESFDRIKQYLTSEPILTIFDPALQTVIYTDASTQGLGAILKQIQENGEEKTVAYFSRKLTKSQEQKKAIYLECLAIREAIKFWKYWLLGKKFIIYTDHKPLENFNVKVRPDEELGNLLNQISQFEFTITYKPGPTNVEADCLSRNPVLEENNNIYEDIVPTLNILTLQEIKLDQGKLSNKENYNTKHDILLHKDTNRIILTENKGFELIKLVHEKLGHIGEKHLINSIKPYYVFKNMYRHIRLISQTCETCIKNKTRTTRKIGLMSHLGPASKPFEIMSIDSIGGLSRNKSGKKFLHLVVDHFTRYAYGFPSKTQNAKELIKIIKSMNEQNKIKNLLTDQYPAFTSSKFTKFLADYNINHIITAIDNPESNGLNERLNQTIINRLRCKINTQNKTKAWSTLALETINEYNNSTHSVTGFPPSFLMGGTTFPLAPTKFLTTISIENARALAYKNSAKNHELNKKRVDQNRKVCNLEVGDLVYVENGNKLNRNKLDEVRIGPYPIIQKISNSIVIVQCGPRKLNTRQFHISKLTPKKLELSSI
jgi:transposase InsO family protein